MEKKCESFNCENAVSEGLKKCFDCMREDFESQDQPEPFNF